MPTSFLLRPTLRAAAAAARAGTVVVRRDPGCPVYRHLERWALGHLGSVAHERRVADLATDLFDVARPLHGLGRRDLRLLRWAAVVHDVGRAVCDDTHPEDGAEMLLTDPTLRLAPATRRQLAYLTRYHRGKVPPVGRDAVLARTDDHARLARVLGLLRAADALDNRALAAKPHAPPRVAFALSRPGGRAPTLRVTCHLEHDSAKARKVYGRRKKFRLLEDLLGCEVVPQVVTPAAARAVA